MSRLGHLAIVTSAFAIAAVLFAMGEAEAATPVPGQTISTSTTWTAAGSPYVVSGAVVVHGSAAPVLTIEPGVEVRFTTAGSLQFGSGGSRGALLANGTLAQPVTFTSDAAAKARGDWGFLHFGGPSTSPRSYLTHAVVEYAGRGSRTAVEVVNAPVTLTDVTVRESAWAGVYASNAHPTLLRVRIEDNARWGLYAEANALPSLTDVGGRRTSNVPLRVRVDQPLGGLTLGGDAVRRVEWQPADLVADATLPVILDAVTGERYEHLVLGGFTVRNGATWTIPAGSRVLMGDQVQVQVGTYSCCSNPTGRGSLVVDGTEAEPVTIGSASGGTAGGWYGFYFYGYQYPGASALRNATLSFSRDDGIEAYQYPTLTLDNVTLDRNARWGLYAHGGSHFTARNLVVNASGAEGLRISDSAPLLQGGAVVNPGASGVYLSGCGVGRLEGFTFERPVGYAVYADGPCNGLHLDGVQVWNATGRLWRNRLDARQDVTFGDPGVLDVEYWGADLLANATLPLHESANGTRFTSTLLSSMRVGGRSTWTLPPGTDLRVGNAVEIKVGDYGCCNNDYWRGSLVAEGTEAEPITVRGLTGSAPSGWYGFYFYGYQYPGTSVLRNVTLSYGRDDLVEAYHYPSLTLDNVTIRHAARWGLYAHGGSHFQARNLDVANVSADGIRLYDSSPTLHGVTITQPAGHGILATNTAFTLTGGLVDRPGGTGVYTVGCGVARLVDVTLENPKGHGVFADGPCNGVHLNDVRIWNTTGRVWRNRVDVDLGATFNDPPVLDMEYWGADVVRNQTLTLFTRSDGTRFTSTLLSSMRVGGRATFTIPAGTDLRVGNAVEIKVGDYGCCNNDYWRGSLAAEGTQADPIVIRGLTASAPTGWYGLYLYGYQYPGTATLRNVTLSYGRDDLVEAYYYPSLTLDNVTFQHAARWGMYLHGGSHVQGRNLAFANVSADAIRLYDSSPTLVGVTIERPGGHGVLGTNTGFLLRDARIDRPGGTGVYTQGCGVGTLADATIETPAGYGVFADGACNGVHLDGVRIWNSTGRAWRSRIDLRHDAEYPGAAVRDLEYWGGDVVTNRTLALVTDASGNRFTHTLLSSMRVGGRATWTVEPGVVLRVAENAQIQVGDYSCCGNDQWRGSLVAEGTEAEPITFTALSGSRNAGWYGFYFYGYQYPGASVLRNATIAFSKDDGLETYSYSSLALDNVTFDRPLRWGMYVRDSSPTLRNVVVNHSASHGAVFYSSGASWTGGGVFNSSGANVYLQGCGMVSLADLTLVNATSYGVFADGSCNGAHLRGVDILGPAGRPWRNRVDAVVEDVAVVNGGVADLEYWGADLYANRTLPKVAHESGATYRSVLYTGFTVRNGATWTVPAGSRVHAGENVQIQVGDYGCCGNLAGRGSILAEGTEAEPILFTSLSNNTAQGWYGLYFYGYQYAGTSVLRNATVSLSKDDGMDVRYYSSLLGDNLTLSRNAVHGLRVHDSSPTFRNLRVANSGSHGVYLDGSSHPTFLGLVVEHSNGYGLLTDNGGRPTVSQAVFRNSTSRPLRVRLDSPLSGVSFEGSGVKRVEYWGADLHANATMAPWYDALTGERYDNVLLSSFTVRNHAVWTVLPDVRLLVNENVQVAIGDYGCCGNTAGRGSIEVLGTQAQPVTFTSTSNNTAQGWYGLYLYGYQYAGASVLRNATFSLSKDDGVDVRYYSSALFDNVTLSRNAVHGARIHDSSPTFRNVRIVGSGSHGLYGDGSSHPVLLGGSVEDSGAYGVISDNGGRVSLHDVLIRNATHRPARLRVDSPVTGLALQDNGIRQIEYWGVDLSANATLSAHRDDQGRVYDAALLSSFTVRNHAVWTVGPGVRLLVNENVQVQIGDYGCCGNQGGRAHLAVLGTEAEPVLLTSRSNTTAQGWYGLHLYGYQYSGTAMLRNATVSLSKDDGIHAYFFTGVTLDNVTLERNARHGLLMQGGSSAEARRLDVLHQGSTGVSADDSALTWREGSARGSGGSGAHTTNGNGRLTLDGVTVRDNAHHGIQVYGGARLALDDAAVLNNSFEGIHVDHSRLDTARNVNVSQNGRNGVNAAGSGASVTLRNVTLYGNAASGLNVTGTQNPAALLVRDSYLQANGGHGVDLNGAVGGKTFVNNAFLQNAKGNARATLNNTWNVAKTTGVNLAGGPSLGGNMCSDYGGQDADDDGLGDTPHTGGLGAGADNHPIMGDLFADFTWLVPDVEAAPKTLLFREASRGGLSDVDQWVWDFGDGGQSTAQNETHAYAADGTYAVQLTVANDKGQLAQVTKPVVVDSVDPVSNATLNGMQGLLGWYVSGVNVTLAATDDRAGVASIRYRLDGAAWATYAAPLAVTGDGEHVVEFHALDRNGNNETAKNVTFRIDRTLPYLALPVVNGTAGREGWLTSDARVALSGGDNASGLARILHAVGSAPNETYAGPVAFAQDGVFDLRFRAVDNAGNAGPVANLTVKRDATAPWIEAQESGPLGGAGWYLGAANVTLTGGDAKSGLRWLNASVDGGPWSGVNGTLLIEGHGIHAVNATATDAAGNVLDAPTRLVRIDTQPPVSEHRFNGTLGANGWFVSEVNVTFSGNDSGSGIATYVYSLDDGPAANYTGPVRVAQNGEHRLVYHAVDAAGNAEVVHEVILFLDLNAPTTSLNVTGAAGANGWWLGNVSATLEAEDASNLASILYRLDGGAETEFLAPFGIAGEGVHNVTWHGVSVGGLVEEDKSSLVRIDLTDPTLSVTLNGTAGLDGWYVGPVQAGLAALDGASGIATSFARFDGAPEATYTGPATFATTGLHTMSGRTLDKAGRAAALPEVTVKVDLTDPVTTLATTPAAPAGANGWHTSPVTLNLSASDAGSGVSRILVAVDGGALAPWSGNLTLGEGVHEVAFQAVDLAGRVEALRTVQLKVDLTAPVLSNATAGTLGNAGWFVSAVNLTLGAADATSGVANLTASVDGGPHAAVNGTLRLATTGAHAVVVRATDLAGLLMEETLTVKVDLAAPVATASLSGGANGFGWRASAPTVTLSATDAGSGVALIRYALDGAAPQDYAAPFSVPEGFHNLSFFAVDVAGLVQAAAAPLPVKVDLTNPATTGLAYAPSPRADGWHLAPVTVNLTGSDAPSGLRDFQWWLNATGPFTSGGSLTLNHEGVRVLKVAARDFADRLQAPTLDTTFKLDLNPPTSTHALSPAAVGTNRSVAWRNANVTFTLSSTDAGAGVATRLVNGSVYAGPLVFTQDGVYNLTYQAVDLVDRVEALKTVPAFGIDRAPPVTAATVEGAQDVDGVYKTEVNVTLAATDALSGVLGGPTGLQWRHAGGSFQTYAGPIHLNVSGNYTLEFRARDVAGNLEPLQALALDVFVDTTPPVAVANVTTPVGPGGWHGQNVTVSLSATDLQSSVLALLVRLDGGDLQTILGDAANVTVSGEGTHLLEYGAVDVAGQEAALKNVTLRVDLTPPTLGLDAAFTQGREGWIVSAVNLTPLAEDALSGVHRVEASKDGGAFAPVSASYLLAESGNHTVRLRALDAAGLVSDVVSWSGKLDLDVPTLRHAFVGPQGLGGWYRENVSVLLATSTTDTSGVLPVQYRFDGGDWLAYPGSAIQFSLEGNHTLEALVEDVAGNLARLGPENVGIDRTRPVVTTTLQGTRGLGGWWVSPVRASTAVADLPGVPGANVSGVHDLARSVDGGPNASVALPAVLDLATSGVHQVRDFAQDRALNGVAAGFTVPLDLDDPLLNVSLSGPAGLDGWFTGPVLVDARSLDLTSGPGPARLTREGETENLTGPFLVEGEAIHAFVLHAADLAGRLGNATPMDVRIDATPPDIAALADGPRGADGWFTGPTRVTLDARDLVSGVREITYALNDEAPRRYQGALNLTRSGTHVLSYTGVDVAGNALSREMVLHLDVDAPEANVTVAGVQAANSSWYRSGVTIRLDATDPTSGVASIEYTFDLNSSWIPYTEPIALTAEGHHTIYYRAVDESGLPSVVYQHDIRIDLTTPVVGIRLENTLYTEIDGRVYVSGEFCVEVTGVDAISGVRDAVLRIAGTFSRIVKIDLSVALHCFEPPEGEWEIFISVGVCDFADLCGEDGLPIEDGDGGGGGGGAGMVFLRPFRGSLNLQHVSVPVFSAAFPEDGVEYDTGLDLEVTDPDDPSQTRPVDGKVENPRHPVGDTTVIAGTRVPVWVSAYNFNPQTAELYVDGKLVGRAEKSQEVKYEKVSVRLDARAEGEVAPELVRTNVTQRLFVFQLDTLNLTAGEHQFLAKGIDRKGKSLAGGALVQLASLAWGNETVDLAEEATQDGDVPGPVPAPLPEAVRDLLPRDVTPDLPPEARDRLDRTWRLARIALGLVDTLVLDNYAYLDQHLLAFYEAYETADGAVAEATGRPDPVTVGDTEWGAGLPEPEDLLPEEGSE